MMFSEGVTCLSAVKVHGFVGASNETLFRYLQDFTTTMTQKPEPVHLRQQIDMNTTRAVSPCFQHQNVHDHAENQFGSGTSVLSIPMDICA